MSVETRVAVPIESGGGSETSDAQTMMRTEHNNQVRESRPGENTLEAMQRSMQAELERKRMEWEDQVDKMQQQFFNVNSSSSNAVEGGETSRDIKVRPGGALRGGHTPDMTSDIIDIGNAKNLYTELADGSLVYRLRFDLRDYRPQDIKVKQEGRRLSVHAKKFEESGGSTKVTKQFNRQLDIPSDVTTEGMSAAFTADGILCVEAPASLAKELEMEGSGTKRLVRPAERLGVDHSSRTTVESERTLNQYLYPEETREKIQEEVKNSLNKYLYPSAPTRRDELNRMNMARHSEHTLLYDLPPPPSRTVHVATKVKKVVPGQPGHVTVLKPTCNHRHLYGEVHHHCDGGGDVIEETPLPVGRSTYMTSYSHVPSRNIVTNQSSSYITPRSTVFSTQELLNSGAPAIRDGSSSHYDHNVHVRSSPPPETFTEKQSQKLPSKTPGGVTIIRAGNNYSGSRFRTGDQRLHIEAPKHILGSFYYCADDDEEMVQKAQKENERPESPPRPRYERVSIASQSGRASPTFEKVIYPRDQAPRGPAPVKTFSRPLVVHTSDGHKMKMALEIGPEFGPDDVRLRATKNKLTVEAFREERVDGRPAHKEFRRSFDLAEVLETNTLRAMLAPGGVLMAGSSVKGNLRHEQVLQSILQDFPEEAKPIVIIIEQS